MSEGRYPFKNQYLIPYPAETKFRVFSIIHSLLIATDLPGQNQIPDCKVMVVVISEQIHGIANSFK